MNFVAAITITLLIIIGLFHFYWAFGGKLGINKVIPEVNNEALF
ncbi:hypothetical protein [Sulfurimonas sp.]